MSGRAAVSRTVQDQRPKRKLMVPKASVGHGGSIAAGQAKTHLLRLIDEVSRDGIPIVISKRGKPLVQIAPLDTPALEDPFGCMKGTVTIVGDIVGPEPDIWEAMQ